MTNSSPPREPDWELVSAEKEDNNATSPGESIDIAPTAVTAATDRKRNGVTATGKPKSAVIFDDDNNRQTVTKQQVSVYRKAFEQDKTASLAQNAVCWQSVSDVTLRRDLVQVSGSPYFGTNLDRGGMPALNQRSSGRCWMFGALNLFRFGTRDKLKLGNFEFSESYLYFWHIFEQCNSFMEFIMRTADRAIDERLVAQFMDDPVDDGGDWGIAVRLIRKYGVVPKSSYPETYSSSNTYDLDILTDVLRSAALQIRVILNQEMNHDSTMDDPKSEKEEEEEKKMNEARCFKLSVMADCWRILCIHLGTPPSTFDWKWRDNHGRFHQRGVMTPASFCKEFVTVPFDTYVMLIQDPRNEYYHRYKIEYDQYSSVLGGPGDLTYLNVPAEEMKSMCQKMLQDGHPVWFACNVDEQCDDDRGLWDAKLYDFAELYGISSNKYRMSKADRLRSGGSMGTHVMLFTGVDDVDSNDNNRGNENDSPRRWRVENSWGENYGKHGYYTMNDNWFDEYVFEIVAPPFYLSDQAAAGLDTEPIVLPGWDPMCSLVRRSRKKRT